MCCRETLYYRLTSTLERKLLHGYNLPLSRYKTTVQLTSSIPLPVDLPTQVANIPGRYAL